MRDLINLKQVDKKHITSLFQFFDKQVQLGIKLWQQNTTYTFTNGNEFSFKYDMVQRDKKNGLGLRYELISEKPPIGEGTYGSVYKIKGTIALENNSIRFKKQGSEGRGRVVKVQKHSARRNSLSSLQSEYELLMIAGHLAIKKPTVIETSETTQTSYMVMDRLPGRDLYVVIGEDLTGKNILSTDLRLDLSLALLQALESQVTSKKIIHRDVKPSNIIVKLNPSIEVNIVDFGLGIAINHQDKRNVGTAGFIAPEVVMHPEQMSEKIDVYAMGCVIGLLWGVDLQPYNHGDRSMVYTPEQRLNGLFSRIENLDESEKESIYSLLTGMLQVDPANRFSIEEAIVEFPSYYYSSSHSASSHSASEDLTPVTQPPTLQAQSTFFGTSPTNSDEFCRPFLNISNS